MVGTGKENSLVLVNPPNPQPSQNFSSKSKISKTKAKQWKGVHCHVLGTFISNEDAPVLRDYHGRSVVLAGGCGKPDRGSKAVFSSL